VKHPSAKMPHPPLPRLEDMAEATIPNMIHPKKISAGPAGASGSAGGEGAGAATGVVSALSGGIIF